jgi:hypothetical protein
MYSFIDQEFLERVKIDRRQKHQDIMEKKSRNKNEFADWLFNQFVKAERRDKQDWSLNYWNVLNQYAEVGLSNKEQYEETIYVFKLDIIITEAMAGWNTHLLILRGEETEQDYKERMEKYEERLRTIGHDETTIKQMLDYKIKLNYGTD